MEGVMLKQHAQIQLEVVLVLVKRDILEMVFLVLVMNFFHLSPYFL